MASERKCVLFIDHSFHQQSKSSTFFRTVLEREAPVVEIWDHTWKGEPSSSYRDVASLDAFLAVFWQAYPSPEFLASFRKPIVVIPMFDDVAPKDRLLAMAAYRVTAVCFSEAVEAVYREAGIDTIPLRYAPAPRVPKASDGPLSLFFWDRGQVAWADVRTLIGEQPLGKVFLKQTPDPGYAPSSVPDEDRERFDLEIITDWISKEAYDEILDRCQLYVAPRWSEGIGMSFLEAMARGLAVLAPDAPTMSEYIEDGRDGYLFSSPVQLPIDLGDARAVGERARVRIERLKEAYDARLPEVVRSILALPYRSPRYGLVVRFKVNVFVRRVRNLLWRLTHRDGTTKPLP